MVSKRVRRPKSGFHIIVTIVSIPVFRRLNQSAIDRNMSSLVQSNADLGSDASSVWNFHARFEGRDPFNQNSNRSDRENWSTSKGGPVFSKLFRLDRTDPLSFGPKFPEILVEWIAPLIYLIFTLGHYWLYISGFGRWTVSFISEYLC